MKIGILAFNRSLRFMGGALVAPDVYKEILTAGGFDAEIVAINATGCPLDYPWTDRSYLFNETAWKDELPYLYDRFILINYTSLGRCEEQKWHMNRICHFLDSLPLKSYALVLHDEYEIMGPFIKKLVQEHGIRDRWLFNSESVREHLGAFFNITGGVMTHARPGRYQFTIEEKTGDIHYLGRLYDEQKLLVALLTLCSSLGRDVTIYGREYRPFIEKMIPSLSSQLQSLWNTSYKGPVTDSNNVISVRRPFKFSWNVVRGYAARLIHLRTFQGEFMPRLEQSTYEAIRAGSLPILVKSTIPSWFPHEYAIILDNYDVNRMIYQIKDQLIYDSNTVERLHECNNLLDRRIELSLENLREILNF